ncbi:MAG: hypothetical protein V3V00_05700 [Saprospiraceae bacterium]
MMRHTATLVLESSNKIIDIGGIENGLYNLVLVDLFSNKRIIDKIVISK